MVGDVWHELWKSLHCLALELHEDVHMDVMVKWKNVLTEKERLEAEVEGLKKKLAVADFLIQDGAVPALAKALDDDAKENARLEAKVKELKKKLATLEPEHDRLLVSFEKFETLEAEVKADGNFMLQTWRAAEGNLKAAIGCYIRERGLLGEEELHACSGANYHLPACGGTCGTLEEED